jgi:histidinol-phosphate phosphatase family protein
MPGRAERLKAFVAHGVRLGAVTNQAGVAMGQLTRADMEAGLARTAELLGVPIDARACIHAPDAGCWCRKPQPGLLLMLIRDLDLDPGRTWFVGDRDSDRLAAEAAGLRFVHADVFFSDEGPEPEDFG